MQKITVAVSVNAYGLVYLTLEQIKEALAKAYRAGKNGDKLALKIDEDKDGESDER